MDGRKNKLSFVRNSFTTAIKYIFLVYFVLIFIEVAFFSQPHNGVFNALFYSLGILISFTGIVGTIILWIIVGSVISIINLVRKK